MHHLHAATGVKVLRKTLFAEFIGLKVSTLVYM